MVCRAAASKIKQLQADGSIAKAFLRQLRLAMYEDPKDARMEIRPLKLQPMVDARSVQSSSSSDQPKLEEWNIWASDMCEDDSQIPLEGDRPGDGNCPPRIELDTLREGDSQVFFSLAVITQTSTEEYLEGVQWQASPIPQDGELKKSFAKMMGIHRSRKDASGDFDGHPSTSQRCFRRCCSATADDGVYSRHASCPEEALDVDVRTCEAGR